MEQKTAELAGSLVSTPKKRGRKPLNLTDRERKDIRNAKLKAKRAENRVIRDHTKHAEIAYKKQLASQIKTRITAWGFSYGRCAWEFGGTKTEWDHLSRPKNLRVVWLESKLSAVKHWENKLQGKESEAND